MVFTSHSVPFPATRDSRPSMNGGWKWHLVRHKTIRFLNTSDNKQKLISMPLLYSNLPSIQTFKTKLFTFDFQMPNWQKYFHFYKIGICLSILPKLGMTAYILLDCRYPNLSLDQVRFLTGYHLLDGSFPNRGSRQVLFWLCDAHVDGLLN